MSYSISSSRPLHHCQLCTMPLIEEIDDEETTSQRSPDELLRVLNQLSARLRLPDDLLPSFMAGDLRKSVL